MRTGGITRRALLALLGAIALLCSADGAPVEAAPAVQLSRSFPVGLRVDTRCVMLVNDLYFPDTYVSGQAAPLDAESTIYVNCDAGRRVSIRLDEGLYPAPGSTDRNPRRRMRNGAGMYVTYNLYENAARTRVWDDWRPGVKTARAWPVWIPVYGRVDGGQTVMVSTYSDTITARLFL